MTSIFTKVSDSGQAGRAGPNVTLFSGISKNSYIEPHQRRSLIPNRVDGPRNVDSRTNEILQHSDDAESWKEAYDEAFEKDMEETRPKDRPCIESGGHFWYHRKVKGYKAKESRRYETT